MHGHITRRPLVHTFHGAMDQQTGVRLDKWLWATRLFKTRALAAEAVTAGKVRVNGAHAKPAKTVRVGDRLDVRRGPYQWCLTVRAAVPRRVSAAEAGHCYEEDAASKRARETLATQLKLTAPPIYEGKGRPTKKERRTLERWRDRG
jgi:ribosome-associated heat shock protein Hsp15